MKYIKSFENHSAYEEAQPSLILPNVSLCVQENEVHYNPLTPPAPQQNNIITYTASAKLSEGSVGLHTNSFSGASGQLSIITHTFENGTGTIEFDGDVKYIGNEAFMGCYGEYGNLISIVIPNTVVSIGDSAFEGCYYLTNINIPNSITSIGEYAFCGASFDTETEAAINEINPDALQC